MRDSSDCLRTRDDSPDSSTGTPWSVLALMEAAGLALCAFARPAGSTSPKVSLWLWILASMLGRLPEVERSIPTCSASLVNFRYLELIVRHDDDEKKFENGVSVAGKNTYSLDLSSTSSTMYLQQYSLVR